MEEQTDTFEHYRLPLHRKRRRVVCKDPTTCPFCQAGIERKVQFQIYDIVDNVTRTITMPEKLYNKMMEKKGGDKL